jgi:hypothetical protein
MNCHLQPLRHAAGIVFVLARAIQVLNAYPHALGRQPNQVSGVVRGVFVSRQASFASCSPTDVPSSLVAIMKAPSAAFACVSFLDACRCGQKFSMACSTQYIPVAPREYGVIMFPTGH